MDWRSVNFDWNQIRAFLVTAEEGSLSAAARSLGLTQPTLSRQVAALEVALGVALFERVGRGFELTPSGCDLVEYARAMGEAANSLSLSASGKSGTLAGNISISSTEVMGVFYLPPILKKLRQKIPNLNIELIASNKTSDLRRREADIAIRSYRPTEPDLIARKIRQDYYSFYATPEYLRQLGAVKSPSDLSDASFIGFDHSQRFIDILSDYGFNLTESNFPIISEHNMAQWELVKQGLGIGVMERDIGDAEPQVERVIVDLELPTTELWLVAHRELKNNRRIRAVYDFLIEELGQSSESFESGPLWTDRKS